MAAITDLSDLINRMTGGNSGTPENLFCWIDNRVGSAAVANTVAARWTSLWVYNKSRGGQGAVPTTAAVPTNSTNGSLLQTNPGGGREKWLVGWGGFSTVAGSLLLYDRLLHRGGLSGTVVTAQTVGGTLTRNTGGVGNQIWVEIYTQIGTTTRTITADYTNQDGNPATTKAVNIGNTGLREAQRMIPLPLADGDTGVRAVEDVTLSATTGTAGDFGITIVRPLATINFATTNTAAMRDYTMGLPGIPEIDTNACLSLAFQANGAAAPQFMINLGMVES